MSTASTTKASDLLVCNLEFPAYVNELSIGGYRFVRLPNYQERVCELHHEGTRVHEFEIAEHNGINRPTARVYLPSDEKPAVFKWADNNATSLQDVLLLLTLFTKREVFCPELEIDEDGKKVIERKADDDTDFDPRVALLADPREAALGGILKCSLPRELVKTNEAYANIGFERGLQEVHAEINKEEWKKTYDDGWFLLYARMAFRQQPLESRFIHCWTIWEHLFTVMNRHWISTDTLKNIHSHEKISFLLTKFAFVGAVDNKSREQIKTLAGIRNKIVHHALIPAEVSKEDMLLVLQLTEFLIAKILGLIPSNLFNTLDALDLFLKQTANSSRTQSEKKGNQSQPAKAHSK